MLAPTNYTNYLYLLHGSPAKHIFNNYYINQKGQVFYNSRPLKMGWRKSRSGAIYYTFRLWRDGVTETHYVHRLMAQIWIGDIDGKTVNHIDKNPANNDLSNLEIMTMLENCTHKITLRKKLKIVRFETEIKVIRHRYDFANENLEELIA